MSLTEKVQDLEENDFSASDSHEEKKFERMR